MEHNKHMHLLCIYNGDICHLVIFLMDKRQNKGHTIPGECQGVLLTMSFTPLTTRAFWAEMANFAGWAIFVSAYVFHSSLGYGPDAGLWDSEPLQCVNKEFMQGYPRVKGPKSVHDRIAIIGAGPSGLHMAYELKKRGFRNIVIFESRDEVGGKSSSRLYRNV
eukprot:XP_019926030.1 PREDICTED: uncharacterized protein LOC109619713 [Crassostrea gigas]